MKRKLRKMFAFLLLLISCLPFLFTVFFLCKQSFIRHEMKERLEKEFLHTISVSNNEVIWIKYNKEIRINDKLFDVESFYEKNGVCYFKGLFDSEETALNKLLEKKNGLENENVILQLFQWLQSPCTLLAVSEARIVDQYKISYAPILFHISSPFINTPTHPPQV